jgi:hypothetical protein
VRFREVRAQLRSDMLARHANELSRASRWRRFWVRLRIEREVNAELAKRFPRRALYFART